MLFRFLPRWRRCASVLLATGVVTPALPAAESSAVTYQPLRTTQVRAGVERLSRDQVSGGAAPSGGTVDDPFYGQVLPEDAYLAGPGRSSSYPCTIASLFLDQRSESFRATFSF